MGFLEKLFLRQFQADGADYVIVRRGQKARFSATEVLHFLEEWRLLWLAKWLWGGWLVIGVVAPLWLVWRGYGAGAFALSFVATGFMVAVLTPVWRKPVEAAELRLPPPAEGAPRYLEPPSPWLLLAYGGIALVTGLNVFGSERASSWSLCFIWSAVFLGYGWKLVRHRRGKPTQQLDPVAGALLGLACLGIVTVTALDTERRLFDVVVAGAFLALALGVVGQLIWKHVRPERFA